MTTRLLVSVGIATALLHASRSVAIAQGDLNPPGGPAPTMKSLDQLDSSINQTTVKVDQAATKIDRLSSDDAARRFHAYVRAAPSSGTGARACNPVAIPSGKVVLLHSVVATTTQDAGAVPYIKFSVKTGVGASKFMTLGFPGLTNLTDPVSDTRTGNLQTALRINGGGISDVALGEAYSLTVCVQSSASELAQGDFILTGSYDPAP